MWIVLFRSPEYTGQPIRLSRHFTQARAEAVRDWYKSVAPALHYFVAFDEHDTGEPWTASPSR